MEIKFIVVKLNGERFDTSYQQIEEGPNYCWTPWRSSAKRFDTYPEAEELIKSLKEVGIFNIEKIFIK